MLAPYTGEVLAPYTDEVHIVPRLGNILNLIVVPRSHSREPVVGNVGYGYYFFIGNVPFFTS